LLEEIGEQLRAKRESLGLSLDDIQRATKIRSRYLHAVEEGEEEVLPADVYTRGIIRRYCSEVGLDEEPVLEMFDEWRREHDRTSLNERLSRTPGSGNITLRPVQPSRGWGILVIIAAVLVLAGSAGAAYYLIILPQAELSLFNNDEEPAEDPNDAVEEEPEEEEEPDGEPPEEELEEPPEPGVQREEGPEPDEITYTVEGAEDLHVSVSAAAPCWIRIWIDGERLPDDITLQPGDEADWTADSSVTLRAGYPQGLIMTVNEVDMEREDASNPRYLRFRLAE